VVHGALHLLGFDDLNEADCKKMRQAEQDALLALDFMK
jgi:ssRNA-specific RNase YbeY (16S rRNA maturation enzyme)